MMQIKPDHNIGNEVIVTFLLPRTVANYVFKGELDCKNITVRSNLTKLPALDEDSDVYFMVNVRIWWNYHSRTPNTQYHFKSFKTADLLKTVFWIGYGKKNKQTKFT